MSDQTDLKIAEAVIANGYIVAVALVIGVGFGALWALIPLGIGLTLFLAGGR